MLKKSLIAIMILAAGCEPINRYLNQEDDWFGEELVEEALEYKTGIDVDLTPSTPE